jgi:putative transposase
VAAAEVHGLVLAGVPTGTSTAPAGLRRECTDRILILGERHLTAVRGEYTAHHSDIGPHRSLSPRLPAPRAGVTDMTAAEVKRRSILGGLINEYAQAA